MNNFNLNTSTAQSASTLHYIKSTHAISCALNRLNDLHLDVTSIDVDRKIIYIDRPPERLLLKDLGNVETQIKRGVSITAFLINEIKVIWLQELLTNTTKRTFQ